jgi:hypothetical protein
VKRSQLQRLVKQVFTARGLSLTEVSRQAMLDVAALAASAQREEDRAEISQRFVWSTSNESPLPALPTSPDDLEP